jgi:hypothetical protein
MTNENSKIEKPDGGDAQHKKFQRRTVLKALAGIPVLGVFVFEYLKKSSLDQDH